MTWSFCCIKIRKRYFGQSLIRFRTKTQNHAEGVYIIKTKFCISPRRKPSISSLRKRYNLRLMIYTYGDDIHDCVVMICQACGLDKKIRQVETCRIFWLGWRDLNSRMTESESVALPLGDTPIFFALVLSYFS